MSSPTQAAKSTKIKTATPAATPKTGWPRRVFDTLVSTISGFIDDNCLVLAGAVAFSAIQSIIPIILGFLAVSSLFLQDDTAQEEFIRQAYNTLPQLRDLNINFTELLKGWIEGAGWATVLSLLVLLWTGSGVFGQLKFAVNIAFRVERDQRNPIFQIALQLVMLIILGGLLLLAFLINLAAGLIFNAKIKLFGISPFDFSFVLPILAYLIPFVLEATVFAILFKIAPARRGVRWKPVMLAAFITALLFELLKYLFGLYVQIFGAANSAAKTYGAIGGVFVFLFFLYLVGAVILFGAELAATLHGFRSGLGAAKSKDAIVQTPAEEIDRELVPTVAANRLKAAEAELADDSDDDDEATLVTTSSTNTASNGSTPKGSRALETTIGGVVLLIAVGLGWLFRRKPKA